MTYPGMVLLVGIGVGIATFLYYMFTESNHSEEQNQQYPRDRRPSNCSDDWTSHSSSSEKISFRRNSSNSLRSKEGRNITNKEDTSNCTICQYILIESNIMQLPCGHIFHEHCIESLRSHIPKASCPNCRKPFKHT